MSTLLKKALRRRAFLQALVAVPAFSLFRALPPVQNPDDGDEIVEVGGWILKRSELA